MHAVVSKPKTTTRVSAESAEINIADALQDGPDIFVAAQYGDWKRIEWLIEQGKATAKDTNEQGITPLHWAAINDRLLACKILLDNGADVNAAGGDLHATPMMWAAKSGHSYIVHLLMTQGGDPAMLDSQGYNVLQLATHSSNVMLILYLLHVDVPVDSVDPQGHTCLMWAAYQGDALSVEAFLNWGADVNSVDEDGLNALHWAVVKGNRMCIRRIIEEGGDLTTKQKEGKTPRTLAIELKTAPILESALELLGRNTETGARLSYILSDEWSLRAIFLLPYAYIGIAIKLFAVAPIMISLPISAVLFYALQQLCANVLTPYAVRGQGVHKTPFLAGIFSGSAFWTTLHWMFVVLPSIGQTYMWLNILFGATFAFCMYNFTSAMRADPGYVPKNGGRTEQRETIEELLRDGNYDARHYCITCCIRRPLRSKHCKICNRCVAKHDHHCPWVNNCVALRNHKAFVYYVLALFFGIPMYAVLIAYHLAQLGPVARPVECTLLSLSTCNWMQIDAFGIILAAWDCLQLSWISMLAVVQLYQIARAVTTQEVVNFRQYGDYNGNTESRTTSLPDQVRSVIAAGTTDPTSAGLDGGDQRPPEATCEHGHHHGRRTGGLMQKIARLLGVDQFLDTAKEGMNLSTSSRKKASRRRPNPFDGGVVNNCADFWGSQPDEELGSGGGKVNRVPVDFYKLYVMPHASREMYSSVPTEEV